MSRGRYFAAIALSIICLTAPAPQVSAVASPQGLSIMPQRQFTTIDVGTTQSGQFTISNLTRQLMTVSLFVKQFSVSDYIYDYTFSTPNDWVFLSKDQVQLKAGESQKIDYTVTVPKGSAPGGHYYTLFASARVQSGGVVSAMQTTDLLYVTVNGKLTTSNHIEKTAVPQVVFDSRIPYQMDVRNTGNVHYFAYFTGSVKGFLTDNNEPLTSHLLMPGTVKHITGTVPSPLWPGIYTVTYGYQTENTPEVTRSSTILFVPPWSIVLVALIIMAATWQVRRKQRHNLR